MCGWAIHGNMSDLFVDTLPTKKSYSPSSHQLPIVLHLEMRSQKLYSTHAGLVLLTKTAVFISATGMSCPKDSILHHSCPSSGSYILSIPSCLMFLNLEGSAGGLYTAEHTHSLILRTLESVSLCTSHYPLR